jgi:2-oxoglutarate ferredoxin oxidoreductase subunit beta
MGNCNHQFQNTDVAMADYYAELQPTWCGGCGNFGIWAALKRALVELNLQPHQVLLCFDIGCNGNMSDKIRGYRLHSLHGRVLTVAAGAKIANPNLVVIAMAGDGATYSEGISHFIASVRSNYPITFLVHNNGDYGLTTGQASATTPQCAPRTASPDGPTSATLNPIDLALSLDPAYVARGFSGDIKGLTQIIKDAISNQNKGFSYVDILQACPTYNIEMTHNWYLERMKRVEEIAHDPTDIQAARALSYDTEKIYTGLLYKNEAQPSFIDRINYRDWKTTPVEEVEKHDVTSLLKSYR